MNETEKFLKKLTVFQRAQLQNNLSMLYQGQLASLNIVKLKNTSNLFRLRVGRIRVIYIKTKKGIVITSIGNRDEHTYRDL